MLENIAQTIRARTVTAALVAALSIAQIGCGPEQSNAEIGLEGKQSKRPPASGSDMIVVHPSNRSWFAHADGRRHFLAGAGDPEDFFYRGTLQPNGTRNGDQQAIIATLIDADVNGIYIQAVRSHGGDGDRTHNPFESFDPSQALNDAVLDQWSAWLAALDAGGVVIYFFFYDDESLIWDSGDVVTPAERRFLESLVNRFEHLEHLVWVVAEEFEETLSPVRVARIAQVIRNADDYKHPIGVHRLPGTDFSEFADDPHIDQFLMQLGAVDADEMHRDALTAVRASRGRYNVNMSEAAEFGTGEIARKKAWATAMGGAYVMVLGMDVVTTDPNDLQDLHVLATFFESIDFERMTAQDARARFDTQYVLASPQHSYILYAADAPPGGRLGVSRLVSGEYDIALLDPKTGQSQLRQRVTLPRDGAVPLPDGWRGEVAVAIQPSKHQVRQP